MTGDSDSVQVRHKSKLSQGGTRDCEDDECVATEKKASFILLHSDSVTA